MLPSIADRILVLPILDLPIEETLKQQVGLVYQLSEEQFEDAIDNALEAIPTRFIDALDNVAIIAEDEPTDEDFLAVGDPTHPSGTTIGSELLGLYDGVNLTERGEFYEMVEPDVIYIFKGPHERICNSYQQIVTEITKTVIHEIGHYFGLDDEQLHAMGY